MNRKRELSHLESISTYNYDHVYSRGKVATPSVGNPSASTGSASKRMKTESDYDENKHAFQSKLDEIKTKYTSRRGTSAALAQINYEGLKNISHLNIKQVDSPISCLQKSTLKENYFSAKDFRAMDYRFQQDRALRHQTPSDPRIQNIDKINQKIKNILKTIEGSEQQLSANRVGITRRIETPSAYQTRTDTPSAYQTRTYENRHNIGQMSRPSLASQLSNDFRFNGIKDHKITAEKKYQQVDEPKHSYLQPRWDVKSSRPVSNWHSKASELLKREQDTNVQSHNNQSIASRQSLSNNETFEESIVINKPFESFNEENQQKQQKPTHFVRHQRVMTEQLDRPQMLPREETKKLYEALKKQVELDQQFRNKKYAFKQIKDENKNEKLLSELCLLDQRVMNREQLLNQFKITEEEFNPFYTCREDGDYANIAQAYVAAQQHWAVHILNQFSLKKLSAEGFSEKTVDLDRKGYLIVEDFVRLLNLEADTFVRNRDLQLIYRRLGGNRILFTMMMKRLCHDA